jgi:shikimate dehydrogenase
VQVEVATSAEGAVDGVDGLVNGTPVGMSWNPGTPVDLSVVEGQRWIFDAIYSPIETPLMVRAASAGLARITGFDLFLGQAIDAFEIFTGHDLEPQLVTELETSLGILERERGV